MDKMDELLKLSCQIMDEYIDLLVNPVYKIDCLMKNDKIQSILNMVLNKYNLIRSVNVERLCLIINSLDNYDIYERPDCIARIKNKLIDYNEIIKGNYITVFDLGLNNIDNNMKFSTYDVILSIININVIKLLKEKIYSLNSYCDSDDIFIDLLKERLEISKIQLLYNTGLSEVISLYYMSNIDEIPLIDMNIVRNIKSGKFNDLILNTASVYLSRIVMELSKIRTIRNNDNDVFKYLVLITQVEMLLNYLDKSKLEELYNFCIKLSDDDNVASMLYVKRLVKNKMKGC